MGVLESMIDDPWSLIDDPWLMAYGQWSFADSRWSLTGDRIILLAAWSMVNYRCSVIGDRWSMADDPLSMIDDRSPKTNHWLSTFDDRGSITWSLMSLHGWAMVVDRLWGIDVRWSTDHWWPIDNEPCSILSCQYPEIDVLLPRCLLCNVGSSWEQKWNQIDIKTDSKIDLNFERPFCKNHAPAAGVARFMQKLGWKLGAKIDEMPQKSD